MTTTASPTLRPVTIDYGTGPDTLVLNIAQDAYLGNAQYQVFVDGKRVGGTFTASALNSLGQTDSLTLRGDWGPGAHSVSVKFVNDFQVAGEGDRNLFVRGVSFNGDTIPQASANLWSGNSAGEFRTVLRPVNGALSYGSGPDAVTLSIAQDYYQGNAQYQVLVDGKPIDAIFAANAQRKAGQADIITIRGDFGPGQHEISVKYLNDKGDSGGDRNLFINSIAFNGNTVANSAKNLWQSGSYSVTTPIAPDKGAIDYGSGPDTLVLKINQDACAGNAQYIVTVDGKQVGGLFEASASRRAGETDTVTLHGNWGSGAHDIKVTYLNDFRDAATGGDRNMYVAGATYNGATIADARGNLWSAGSVGFSTPANLVGTAGADKLVGGKGNDILRGGLGADTLTGGAGSDLFIHAKGDEKDTITDFTVSGAEADRIDLSRYGFASFDHIKSHLVQKGADTLLTLNATDSILLKNVVASTLTAANFSFSDVKAANTSGFDVGVNLTGPEYIAPANAPSGWISGDGLFPTTADLEYFAAKGMGTIRLALAWETLQPSLNGAFNADYLAKIESVVTQSKALGIDVILDIHNYGSYNGNLIGTSAVPTSAFTDLWSKLAGKFANADNVKFDLMNEPQQATAAEWLGIANKAIAAIRATGATQEILVPGVHWQAGFNWVHTDNATAFAKPGAIVDPLNNFAIQIHQYLDPTTAGTSDQAVSATIGVERLTAVTDWARTYNYKLYLGETGVGENALGLTALDNMMAFLKSNQDVWTGVAYFAAGQGFAPDYMYSIQPENGVFDTPQMDVLEKFIDVKTVKTAQADGSTRIDTFGHGADHASITDVVNANGTLVSRSVYTANGTLTSAVALKADDTFLFDDFDGTSGKKTHEALIKTVQGATKTLADTTWAADGSFVSRTFDEATGNVARLENHDAAGRLTFMQENTATAHSRTQYLNGVIQSSSTIDIYGNLIEAFTYNTSGKLLQHDSLDSRGYHIVEQYDPSTGRNTARGDFNANWQMQSWTSFEADGSRMITLMHADGSKQIDYYAAHATSAYKVDQFGIDGHYIGTQMLSGMI